MAGARSPEEINAFLRLCIESVESLEVLGLLLDQSAREWTAETLSREIRSSAGSVEKRLAALKASRVIKWEDASGRYVAYSLSTEEIVRETIAFYRLRPHRVMEILYSKPESAMQSFADAFRFGKKEKP